MATARQSFNPKEMKPAHKDILKIRGQIEEAWSHMKKDKKYTPNVQEVEKFGEIIIRYIDSHHTEVNPTKSYLKDAIIDLTEIPVMQGDLLRVSIQESLRCALENIDKFCSKTF